MVDLSSLSMIILLIYNSFFNFIFLGSGTECEIEEGSLAPQILLFVAQLIAGVGGSLYYTLGIAYMDDNVKKSKTPALIST